MFKRIVHSNRFAARARWIFALILVPPFALFFHAWMGGRPSAGPGGNAGVLFGRQIPWETFQQEYALIRRNAEPQFGGEIPQQFEPVLRQQTWDRLMLREEARRKVRVSDEEIAAFLRSQTTFQDHGRFAPELYYRFARGVGMSPQMFEERVRDDLSIQRLLDRVKSEVQVSDEEVRQAYATARERIRASIVVFRTADVESHVPALTEENVRASYTAHQEQWQEPTRRVIEYVGLSLPDVIRQLPAVTDEQLQAYYDDHQDAFQQADGTTKPLDSVREDVRQRAQAEQATKRLTTLALDLQDDLDTGLRFEEVAAARQLQIRRTEFVDVNHPGIPEGPSQRMLNAAFQVTLGHTTELFRDPDGLFVLRPVEEQASRVPAFEEIRDRVEQAARDDRARGMAHEQAAKLHDRLSQERGRGLTLDEACAAAGVTRTPLQPFRKDEPIESLGSVPNVAEALFGLPLGGMSDVLEIPDGFVIGFLEERLPFDEAQFEKDRDGFRQTVIDAKQQEHLRAWVESLRKQANFKSFLEQGT